MTDPHQFVERLIPAWRASLPSDVPRPYFDAFVKRRRGDLVRLIGAWLKGQVSAASAPPDVTELRGRPGLVEAPPDLITPGTRTRANLAAIQILAREQPVRVSPADRRALLQYSDWGGLSIDKVRSKIPEHLTPESFSLLHGYLTPTIVTEAIADVVCPLLPELAGLDRIVRVLEPSVGSGRFVRSLGPPRCVHPSSRVRGLQWITVELSRLSSAVFTALHPDVQHFGMSFERWVRLHGARHQGTINLVLCNPPYGERGATIADDHDRDYSEATAYAYFMRRALDLLVPRGLGVFLVPAGFLSGATSRPLRERLLRRHHLSAAYRLPSQTLAGRDLFPGAAVVVDVLFWRGRGGELAAVDRADRFIAEGRYFAEFPDHILGEVRSASKGDTAWRDAVVGDFTGLPALDERPFCSECTLRPVARPVAHDAGLVPDRDPVSGDMSAQQQVALALGQRVTRYLALYAAADAEKLAQLWPELHAALLDFARTVGGNPRRHDPLRKLKGRWNRDAIAPLLGAFEPDGRLIPALAEPPRVVPKYAGQPSDVVAQAELLFRQQRHMSLGTLIAFHAKHGGELTREQILDTLFAAEWNLDGDAWDRLVPKDAYFTGIDLWAKYDRARARGEAGDPRAQTQAAALLRAIGPAVFEDIQDLSPVHGYVPLALLSQFVSNVINHEYGPITLVREQGIVKLENIAYGAGNEQSGVAAETLHFLGWLNHDRALFSPRRRSVSPTTKAERRAELVKGWEARFAAWLAADPARRDALVDAYNRTSRGRLVPTYSSEPLDIARWGANAPTLMPHQIAGARRVLANGGGIIAFGVGTGKTLTAIAAIARARQEGWVRRPVILVPGTLVWQWAQVIACALPDYRVPVIGSKQKRISRGPREGLMTSEPDTPEERADKWRALQTGQVDAVILSYDALALTRMSEEAVLAYTQSIEAIQRSVTIGRPVSERKSAAVEHQTAQWVRSTLRLPRGRKYDPGIVWDEIGIDMLVVDEAASFKNLYMPQSRDGGRPRFMGAGTEGARRAWQLDFRAAAVRSKPGGSVVLLTATPAKNSPLEFYNLIQYINPKAFSLAGIHDPEQFIDRFLRIEDRAVLSASFSAVIKPACVGFKNLDDLRTIIQTYTEFRTAQDVGVEMPKPVIERVPIAMGEEQETKYAAYVSEIQTALSQPRAKGGASANVLGLLARLSLVALHPSLDDGYDYFSALEGGTAHAEVPADDEERWTAKGWERADEEAAGEGGDSDDSDDGDGLVLMRRILPRPVYESPKLVECARRVAASPHCGHIIFCEPVATHQWIREVLVAHGVPRARIAVLNANATTSMERVQIARGFNGLAAEHLSEGDACAGPEENPVAPRYDVVIANSVAYEGIDLQVRTCSIHHIDLPWTPSDLEQRNGRAIRKGNTIGTVTIYYYFAEGSTDGYRFNVIQGKAGWLGDLFSSQIRDTNNPGAQQHLSPEEILYSIARDKEQMRATLEAKKELDEQAAREKIALEASRLLRQASARFREARQTRDGERAARLREEAETRLAELGRYNPDAWPWAPWVYAARDTDVLVLDAGGAPLYEGLRVAIQREGAQTHYVEFGEVLDDTHVRQIGRRLAGAPNWTLVPPGAALDLRPDDYPHEGAVPWPDDDDALTEKALALHIAQTLRGAGTFAQLGWRGASDAWLDRWWPRMVDWLTYGLARSGAQEIAPIVAASNKLSLQTGKGVRAGRLLAPTEAGWREFLELAPDSGHSFGELKAIGLSWWRRQIPQDLLSRPRKPAAEAATAAASDAPTTQGPSLEPLSDADLVLGTFHEPMSQRRATVLVGQYFEATGRKLEWPELQAFFKMHLDQLLASGALVADADTPGPIPQPQYRARESDRAKIIHDHVDAVREAWKEELARQEDERMAPRLRRYYAEIERADRRDAPRETPAMPAQWDLVLLGCGDRKVQHEERLLDLYVGPVYLAHKAILEHIVGLHAIHGILSGLYGWAEPDRRVKPYSATLDTVIERQEWSEKILDQIREWLETLTSGELFLLDGDPRMIPGVRRQPKILVLAGSDYVDGWAEGARKLGVIVDDPLHGMALGPRRALAKAVVGSLRKRPTREEFLTFVERWRRDSSPDPIVKEKPKPAGPSPAPRRGASILPPGLSLE